MPERMLPGTLCRLLLQLFPGCTVTAPVSVSVHSVTGLGVLQIQHCILPSLGSDVPGRLSMGPHAADICAAYHAGPAHSSSGTFQMLGFNLLKHSFLQMSGAWLPGRETSQGSPAGPSELLSLLCLWDQGLCSYSSLRTSLQCPHPPTSASQELAMMPCEPESS